MGLMAWFGKKEEPKEKKLDEQIVLSKSDFKDSNPESQSDKYKDCDIEHMGSLNRYYPRWKERYIRHYTSTDKFELMSSRDDASYSSSKEEAIKILDRYLKMHVYTETTIIKL